MRFFCYYYVTTHSSELTVCVDIYGNLSKIYFLVFFFHFTLTSSAGFFCDFPNNPIILMLLCDVVLGLRVWCYWAGRYLLFFLLKKYYTTDFFVCSLDVQLLKVQLLHYAKASRWVRLFSANSPPVSHVDILNSPWYLAVHLMIWCNEKILSS